jgi:N-acetylglucosaminyldiphosphoundecaprenol N-acetyl-beta-D-mannosaminyltransferase
MTSLPKKVNEVKRVYFIGVPLDVLTMRETVEKIDDAIQSRTRLHHVVLNVAKFVTMRSNEELKRDVIESDIINIDGMGIVFAAWLLGLGNVERVAGVDLMQQVLQLCSQKGYRPYFLGAKPEVLEKAIAEIRVTLPTLEVAGFHDGYFKREEEPQIVNSIRNSNADCLFIGISSPLKERFIRKYRDELGVSFIMGVGGSIDVLAGLTKRAPLWMQRWGLEWAYRLWQEPARMWKRYLFTNTIFAGILMKAILQRTFASR